MSLRPTPTHPGPRDPILWGSAPKPTGGSRRLALLSTDDDLRFGRAVALAVPFVERARGPQAVANRVNRRDLLAGRVTLEHRGGARDRWERERRNMERGARVIAVTDVRECYASITPEIVVGRLASLGAPSEVSSDVGSWLMAFHDAGVRGLPIGPAASAVLADAVLFQGDEALRAAGVSHLRWVDDVLIATQDRFAADGALDRLRTAWARVGLEMHEGKTALLELEGSQTIRDRLASPSGAAPLR